MSKYQFYYYKHIEAFEKDKANLELECKNLELQIQNQWISLKHSLRLKNIGEQIIYKIIEEKKSKLNFKLFDTDYLFSLFSQKSNTIFNKIKSFFKN